MASEGAKQRVIVYIDGYNLYFGLREVSGSKYKWLNLQAFSESFLRPGMRLISVKYFTAITPKNVGGSKQRQDIYLKALQTHCDRLEIFYGRFLSKSRRCPTCDAEHATFEEKKTDVNIACQMLNDAHFDRYDLCYVVSGDGDLVPPLQIIKKNYPKKHAIVARPPRRNSEELRGIADGWFSIGKQRLRKHQLPEKIVSTDNRTLIRPAKWR